MKKKAFFVYSLVFFSSCMFAFIPVFSINAAENQASSETISDGGLIDYLFDRKIEWQEQSFEKTPPLPNLKTLLPFSLAQQSLLNFGIDPASLSVGKDGVVRYTIVISNSSNHTQNIRYEGIHCETYRWRLYSAANEKGDAWENITSPWRSIEQNELNAYHASLYRDYFCDNKAPVKNANLIIQNMRYGRTLNAIDYR